MAQKMQKNPKYRDSKTGQWIEKKTDKMPRALKSIIIETKNKGQKSSTEILQEMRYQ
jgi:hypothetical protein